MNKFNLKQKWDKPSKSLPIIFIGAGGIIKNARKKVAAEFSLEVMIKNYQEYFLDVYNSHNVDLY